MSSLPPTAPGRDQVSIESKAMSQACPVCEAGHSVFYANIDGYDYFRCGKCGSLHIDRATIARIDDGESTRVYNESYWNKELESARERSAGESLVRVGEAILYARRPIRRFLDVGTGPGYLLDTLAVQFPSRRDMFHGIELFPPQEHSSHPNYLIGGLEELQGYFDGGVCIEVVEHLTPKMLMKLAAGLALVSAPKSLWLFNTGMPEMVLGSDPDYLDPLRRGHIVSYGLPGVAYIFEPFGFRVRQVPGKEHAWFAEFGCEAEEPSFEHRIFHPLAENRALLQECALVYQAAFESGRASLYLSQMLERSRWAIGVDRELHAARELYATLQAEHHSVARWAHSLQGQLASLQGEHAIVLNSRSWKLTRPLRIVTRFLQGHRTRQ